MAESGLSVTLFQEGPIPLNVEMVCRPGELLALAGPSGSGKTTVLRAIAGLYLPRHGRVCCAGETWFDSHARVELPPHRRAVGLVFQHYALFSHLTALDNVAAALGHMSRRQRPERARELLAQVNLAGLDKRYPHQLSGGQQQRVAVARALARDPQVLLLDEPFSAVDQVTRRKLYRELAGMRRALAIPIVLVTHDLDEAALLAERLTVLQRGVTLQTGTPEEVAARPVSALVARLMDQPNLFTGRVLGHDPDRQVTSLRWRGSILAARLREYYRPGQLVCWTIPAHDVLLHRRERPSRGERENPMSGRIVEYFVLGNDASVVVEVDKELKLQIYLRVPAHVARRNGLAVGVVVTVSLLAEGIHLMPYVELRGMGNAL